MPLTDAVWIIITIPNKQYEKELNKFKNQNDINNFNNNDIISSIRQIEHEPLEKVLSDTLDELELEEVVWMPTRNGNFFQVSFPCELVENDAVLHILKSKGIGSKPSTTIGFIPYNLFFCEDFSERDSEITFDSNYGVFSELGSKNINVAKKPTNAFKSATQEFLNSVTSRLTVAQVVEGVRSSATITFDFTVYTLMAAFICAFGLVANDPVNIAASMMIEPVMTTVMAMAFGLVIEDKQLFFLGVKNNIISLMMCLIPGYIIGLIFFIWMTEWNPPPNGIWPNPQMQGRGTYEGLIYGVLIALPCGGAVAVSLLNSNYGALVGVAVASTFQPPFLNAGMLWALTTHLHIRGLSQQTVPYNISGGIHYMKPAWAPQDGYTPVYSYDMRKENSLLACVSLALTAVNVMSMLIVAVITLKIKEVMPLDRLEQISPGSQRFFKHDLRIAREYNRKHLGYGFDEPMGKRILAEWAEIAGIDKKQFLGMSPEARVAQLQTLHDIIKDVETDETFRRVSSNNPGNIGLARRLTRPIINAVHNRNTEPIKNPTIWNIEQEISRALNSARNQRDQSHIVQSNDSSPYSTVRSIADIKPSELVAERERRRSNQFLGNTLRSSTRSPYSAWPGGHPQNRTDNFDMYSGVRHRPNYGSRFDPQMEATSF